MSYANFLGKIRVSAVSYTNTKLFVYGIQQAPLLQEIDLSVDTPTDCAQKLIDNTADIGLVPVAALLDIPNYQLLSDYCIGADGAVNSVFIFSNKAIADVKTVRLDPQSRTSNNLAKILIKNHWKVSVHYIDEGEADACVLIGDRTFGKKCNYSFVYDLGEEWKNFTGMPFAFAVWASNKPIPQPFIADFNAALKFGVDHIDQLLINMPQIEGFDMEDYFKNKLDFNFDKPKKEALEKFLTLLKEL